VNELIEKYEPSRVTVWFETKLGKTRVLKKAHVSWDGEEGIAWVVYSRQGGEVLGGGIRYEGDDEAFREFLWDLESMMEEVRFHDAECYIHTDQD